jgi:serine phosphatase RsbU (regulator of sigma subunit)
MTELLNPQGLMYALVLISAFIFFSRLRALRNLQLMHKLQLLIATEALVVAVTQGGQWLGDTIPWLQFLLLYQSVLGVVILFLLKDLMYFKQSRYTRTMFLLLVASLAALIIVGLWWRTGNIPLYPVWLVPLVIMVGASLENQWIHFLNRKQKIWVTLGAGIMLLAINAGRTLPAPPEQSSLLGISNLVFYQWLWAYVGIYTGVGALTLILHLPGAGIVDRQRKQLNSLQTLSEMVTLDQPQSAMLEQIVHRVCEDVNVRRAWLFWRNDPSQPFELGAYHKLSPREEQQLRIALRATPRDFSTEKPQVVNDLEKDNEFADVTPDNLQRGSLMVMPLNSPKIGLLGILMAYRDFPYAFDQREQELVSALAVHGVVALENARFFNQALASQRLEQELSLAKLIQQGLLPAKLPELPQLDIAAVNIPCYAVGGDYFDVIHYQEDRLVVAIADVAGKGVPAALLMANLQANFRLMAGEQGESNHLVNRLNTIIYENTTRDKFITFFYCTIDPNSSKLVYCNAGHNYPMVIRANGEMETLRTGGLILGAISKFEYESGSVDFQIGDCCVLFTDGIIEAMDKDGEEFSEERVLEIINTNGDISATKMTDKILQGVQQHLGGQEQQDDITLIVVKRIA